MCVTDSTESQQACHLRKAGIIALVWEVLGEYFGYWGFYVSIHFGFLKSAQLWFVKIMHRDWVYSMT